MLAKNMALVALRVWQPIGCVGCERGKRETDTGEEDEHRTGCFHIVGSGVEGIERQMLKLETGIAGRLLGKLER